MHHCLYFWWLRYRLHYWFVRETRGSAGFV